MIIVALLPPNYSKTFPNLCSTLLLMIPPTLDDPVKESNGILVSLDIA